MITRITRIGNSRGIRIPKLLLEQCGLTDVVELKVEGDTLRLSKGQTVRHGWEDAFRKAGDATSDELLLEGMGANAFDVDDWQW
ncbi:MAG: peptidase [Bryobacterales bacterium]|nr:peptidase [Bryobacterales bacterium]